VLRSHDELVRAGAEAVAMREILAGLEGYVKTVGEAWVRDAMGGLAEAIVAPLEKLAFDYAEDTNVGAWHVLYNAFCGGGSSGALEQFLAKELSESGAKEALRSFTALSKDAREALSAALPLAERAVFRASEYRGLARCRQRFTDIGVSVAAVDRAFSAADGMLDLLGLISEEMEEADARICAFLRWITSEAAQVDGSDPVEHAVVGDDAALEEHALVTAFFKSMLEDGREAGEGAESVSVLYERLTENVMPELVAASKTMLALPSQTMERVLSDITDGDVASCELNNCYDAANSGSLSMTVRGVSNGIRVFEAAVLTKDQQVFLAQCPLSGPAAGADQVLRWSCALAKVEASGASVALRAVAHLSTDSMAFVEALPKCSDEMEALALFTCSTLGVEFDSCIDESQVSQVIDGTGRISTKFCTASKSPGCSLTVERERCLASTLIGSRRVVLFDLRPTGLDAEPKSEPANADLTQ
jgi:Anaphase-promoting complex, cyclosome, subunit 4